MSDNQSIRAQTIKSSYLRKITLEPVAGLGISQVIREAIKVCAEQECLVEFKFNDSVISISHKKIYDDAYFQFTNSKDR